MWVCRRARSSRSRIDGQAAQARAELAWQNDRDADSLDLEFDAASAAAA